MSNDLMVLLTLAALAGLAGGLTVGWVAGRYRHYRSDPAADGQRELELLTLREAAEQQRAAFQTTEVRLRDEHGKLTRASEHLKSLESQVATYLRQYAQAKDALKKEILQKNLLRTELTATGAQVQALKGRIHELEMERTSSLAISRRAATS